MPVTVRRARIGDSRDSALTTYGPLVLATDSRYGTPLGATQVAIREEIRPLEPLMPPPGSWTPIVCFQTPGQIAGTPAPVTLVDYASAGSQNPGHDTFQVWIPEAPCQSV